MTPSVFPPRSVAQAGFPAGLDEDEIGTVLGHTRWRRYARGELALRAGEDERSLYVITASASLPFGGVVAPYR